MKKFAILFMFALILGIGANAQKYYYEAADDTIKADTNYLPSSGGLDIHNIQDGVISFTFTHTDVADSLAFAGFEWRNSTDDPWTAYTGNAIIANTSTDGQSRAYISTPILDRYLRVRLSCAAGDTVAITGQTLMLKSD